MYWRFIQGAMCTEMSQPQANAQTVLDLALPADLPEAERQSLRALILDELRRLHEGVLALDWRIR